MMKFPKISKDLFESCFALFTVLNTASVSNTVLTKYSYSLIWEKLIYFSVIDILIRNRCIKEEDLISLSKFDKKQLRAILATIKMEKILKSKTLAEPTPGAEPDENGVVPKTKYLYYFINYRKGDYENRNV